MGKRGAFRTTARKFSLNEHTVALLDEFCRDPISGKPAYGRVSGLLSTLATEYLASLGIKTLADAKRIREASSSKPPLDAL